MIPNSVNKAKIPHAPGVYLFQDNKGQILYVGKAADLYHRIASYFSRKDKNPKTAVLVSKISNLETIPVSSELEALILEANLIKKYLPPYNIKLTDNKEYLYIKITKEPFPKILTARKKDLWDARQFFGPFPSSKTVRATLKKLRRIFPWCAGPSKKGKPCFYFHLHLCPGPCAGKLGQADYNKIIHHFSKFLEGKKEELCKELKKEMYSFSKNLEFEKALEIKKMLEGIEYLTQTTHVKAYLENPNFLKEQDRFALQKLQEDLNLTKKPERIECYDISNIQGQLATGSLIILTSGEIDKKWYRKFKIHLQGKTDDVAMMREIIRRRVEHQDWPQPDLILVDGGRGQVRGIFQELQKVSWNIPVFGLAKRLEWLYTPGKEIVKLPKTSLSLQLLQKARDEAHRFAISYHRKLRDRQILSVV